jgi:hypothetical protein
MNYGPVEGAIDPGDRHLAGLSSQQSQLKSDFGIGRKPRLADGQLTCQLPAKEPQIVSGVAQTGEPDREIGQQMEGAASENFAERIVNQHALTPVGLEVALDWTSRGLSLKRANRMVQSAVGDLLRNLAAH